MKIGGCPWVLVLVWAAGATAKKEPPSHPSDGLDEVTADHLSELAWERG